MYIHKENQLAFLAVPRTASRAVAGALKKCGFEQISVHHHTPKEKRDFSLDCYQTIATVRDHMTWFPSMIRLSRKGKAGDNISVSAKDLQRFIKEQAIVPADIGPPFAFEHWTKWADIVLNYELLEEQLDFVLSEYEMKLPEFGHVDFRKMPENVILEPSAKEWIAAAYADEIEYWRIF